MLAFVAVRELSMLEDELESERLEVWFVLMLAFVAVSELSMLEEEFERERLEV